MQSITLQGRFGVYYRIYLQANAIGNLRVNPIKFSDTAYACQFLRSLSAMPAVWQNLAQHLGIPSAQRTNAFQLEKGIAQRLIKGQIHIYALTQTPAQSLPKQQRVLKATHQEFEITLPQQLLNEGRTPNKTFASAADAFELINTLNPTKQQLSALAKSLNISAPPNQQQAQIAQKLAKGEACMVVTQLSNKTLLEHTTEQEPAPKPKPRTLGPQSTNNTAKVEKPVQKNTDAEQAQAMQLAAEEGTPFCEDCAAQSQ